MIISWSTRCKIIIITAAWPYLIRFWKVHPHPHHHPKDLDLLDAFAGAAAMSTVFRTCLRQWHCWKFCQHLLKCVFLVAFTHQHMNDWHKLWCVDSTVVGYKKFGGQSQKWCWLMLQYMDVLNIWSQYLVTYHYSNMAKYFAISWKQEKSNMLNAQI